MNAARGVLALIAVGVYGQGNATLSGIVTGPGGKGLAHVAVQYSEQPDASKRGASLASGTVRSQADGSFSIAKLNAGDVQICVHAEELGVLDPCVWGKAPVFAVSAGKETARVKIATVAGAWLRLRVDDPSQHLLGREDKEAGSGLVVAAEAGNGFLMSGHLVGSDGKGKNLQMLLPVEKQVKIHVLSSKFDVVDEKGNGLGNGLGNGKPLSVTIPAGVKGQDSKISVVGHK